MGTHIAPGSIEWETDVRVTYWGIGDAAVGKYMQHHKFAWSASLCETHPAKLQLGRSIARITAMKSKLVVKTGDQLRFTTK